MAIPRIARVHLVYQFVILTILVFAIGYNEILPDKKYLFLTLIPVFSYQLLIVFCCTEVLPLPTWISGESQIEAIDTADIGTVTTPPEKTPQPEKCSELVLPRKRLTYQYEVKNRKIDSKKSPINAAVPEPDKKDILGSEEISSGIKTFPPIRKLESSKSYYFPHREKRLEDWLETKETGRPYKIRNCKPSKDAFKGPKSHPAEEMSGSEVENCKQTLNISTTDEKQEDPLNTSNELENETSDLTKSYSFPFRQKRMEKMTDGKSDGNLESALNIPLMSQWKELEYSLSSNRVEKRRKSMSTEALDKELKLIKSRCLPEPLDHDFSQSVELSEPVNLVEDVPEKKSNLRHVKSFNRIRQGIVNCFNKKKESFKVDENKQAEESKKPFFQELFLSRESLVLDFDKEKETQHKTRNLTRAKSESRDKYASPSYVSFISDTNFTKFNRANTVVNKEPENI